MNNGAPDDNYGGRIEGSHQITKADDLREMVIIYVLLYRIFMHIFA